jgi:hypothetical protein
MMHRMFLDKVRDGTKTSVWRPGHRDYVPGPAQILFVGDSTVVIDIILTKVEHAVASGKYKIFMDFMRAMGQPEDDDNNITLLEWKLA